MPFSANITCTLNGEKSVNIEIQGLNIDNSYAKRAEYQVAHLLNHAVKRGMNWRNIPEAFQISVLNFIYDKDEKSGVSVYTMKTEKGHTLSNRMSIIFIELPKFKGGTERVENLTSAEKWCKFLLYADDGTRRTLVEDICKSDGGIMAASGILSKISQDDINWARQTSIDLWERDQLSIRTYVEEADARLAEKDAQLAESQEELSETQAELEKKHAQLAEKDAQLLAQMHEIEMLRKELANRKAAE